MTTTKAIFSWSGGKDSALGLLEARAQWDIRCLLTTFSGEHRRVSMHGVCEPLLDEQAGAIGIPLYKVLVPEAASVEVYDGCIAEAIGELGKTGIHTAIYGDIFLEDLRAYRENALRKAGWDAVFPLWKRPTRTLLPDFIARGFKAVVVCVDGARLDASFAGRSLDLDFLDALPQDVDPCGENGEFHSFVYDGPLFRNPVPFCIGETSRRSYPGAAPGHPGFFFCDLVPGS